MAELPLGGPGVDSVNLSFRALSTLPDKLWDSTHLQKLVIAGNPLTSIPNQISQLTNLQIINSGTCKLTTFPEVAVPHLQNLTYLNLSGNLIVDIPENIGKLTNLTELLVSSNEIARLPGSIGDLEHLTISTVALRLFSVEFYMRVTVEFLNS